MSATTLRSLNIDNATAHLRSASLLILLAIGSRTSSVAHSAEPLSRPPNVLLIMTDDQGWGDIRSHENEHIRTPTLDGLAAAGARFDRFFVCPVCAPTRAGLLTGRYHLRTGTHGVTRGMENMRAEEVTIAEVFRSAGYATGCFGKWHNGAHFPYHPNGQGFDSFYGFCAGHWNNYFDTLLERNGRLEPSRGYITDLLTDAAISFMEKHSQRPFLCYVPLNAPHSPWQVPDSYFQKYAKAALDTKTACAYAMCENLDDNLGRLLAKLDELRLSDNTIVMFLTDNGPNGKRFNGGMRGRKGSVHEGGVRVPLFVRWPNKIKPGSRIKHITANIDILPTLVELCGIPSIKTPPLDGISVASLLKDPKTPWPDRQLFTFRGTGSRGAVRTSRWRAIKDRGPWQLFDMQADPRQRKNVANEHPQLMAQLAKDYQDKLREVTTNRLSPLPIHVGHKQRPLVSLPAHEAFLHPPTKRGISYDGRAGWANDWITNWTDTSAYGQWNLHVVRAGTYEVTVRYVCAAENLGSQMLVTAGSRKVAAKVRKAHDPQPLPSPDRVDRIEVYEKRWASLKLGRLQLERGLQPLIIRAAEIPGERACDVKAVELRYVD